MNKRITELRKALQLSQTEFAASLDITQNFVSLVETGKRDFSDRTKKALCALYNVNEVWLETGVGPMFSSSNLENELAGVMANNYKEKPIGEQEQVARIMKYVSLLDAENKKTVLALVKKLADKD